MKKIIVILLGVLGLSVLALAWYVNSVGLSLLGAVILVYTALLTYAVRGSYNAK